MRVKNRQRMQQHIMLVKPPFTDQRFGIGHISLFGLTKARAEKLKPACLIMHPGPINRGVEIDSDVADGKQSVILEQVTNGIAVRMAVLYACAGGAGLPE